MTPNPDHQTKDLQMERIEWGDIEDGQHLTPEDVEALAGVEGEEEFTVDR